MVSNVDEQSVPEGYKGLTDAGGSTEVPGEELHAESPGSVGDIPSVPGGGNFSGPWIVIWLALFLNLGLFGFLFLQHRKLAEQVHEAKREWTQTRLADQERLEARISALEDDMRAAANHIQNLQQKNRELGDLVVANHTAVVNRLAEVDRSINQLTLERVTPLEERVKEFDQRLRVTRDEFQDQVTAQSQVVERISKDSEFIIQELGKKAEQAYLLFMERKLRRQIGQVGESLDEVREEFRAGLTKTEGQLEQLSRDIDRRVQSTVRREVKKETTIDFEPAEMDTDDDDDENDL